MMLKEKIKNKKLMGVPFLGKYVFLKYDDAGRTKKIGGRPFSGK
jgi:hypothetical protein